MTRASVISLYKPLAVAVLATRRFATERIAIFKVDPNVARGAS